MAEKTNRRRTTGMFVVLIAVIMAGAAALALPIGYTRGKEVFGPAVPMANCPEPGTELVCARFNNGLGAWPLDNYRKLLAVETTGTGDDSALGFANVSSERDTAWSSS